MKKSSLFSFLLMLFTLQFSLPLALADQVKITAARTAVIDTIKPIIRGFDPEATFVLDLPAKFIVKELPGTPFTFENVEVREASGELVFNESTLNLYTKKSALPAYVEDALGKAFKSHGITNKINIINIPASDVTQGYWSKVFDAVLRAETLPVIFSAFMLYVILLMGFLLRWKQSSHVNDSLATGLNKIAAAMSEKNTQPIFNETAEAKSKNESKEFNSDTAANDRQLFNSLNKTGVLELLADCYWAQADSYAAYIWPRLPATLREDLTANHSWLAQYARSVARRTEENLGFHQDPYYLKPLPLHGVSNNDLLPIVTKNLGLYNLLPTLRVEQLHLNAKLRLQALNIGALPHEEADKLFVSTKPSVKRDLSSESIITVNSVNEEEELLSMKGLSPLQKSMIESLIWCQEISADKLSSILNDFSAQNLAQAWVGPKTTLEALAAALPQKKRELTLSYVEQIKPSRKSAVYKSICRAILAEVKKQNEHHGHESSKKAS